jgi:hypothetical protein
MTSYLQNSGFNSDSNAADNNMFDQQIKITKITKKNITKSKSVKNVKLNIDKTNQVVGSTPLTNTDTVRQEELRRDFYPRNEISTTTRASKIRKEEESSETEIEKSPKKEKKISTRLSISTPKQKDIDIATSILGLHEVRRVILDPPQSGEKVIDQNNRDYRSNDTKISVDTKAEVIKLQDNQPQANADFLRDFFKKKLEKSSFLNKYFHKLQNDSQKKTLFINLLVEELLYAGSQNTANAISLQSNNHIIKFTAPKLEFSTLDNIQLTQHNTAKFILISERINKPKGKKIKFDIVVNLSDIAERYFSLIENNKIAKLIPVSNLERAFDIVNVKKA